MKNHFDSHLYAIVALLASLTLGSAIGQGAGNPDVWDAPPRAARKKNPVPSTAQSIAAGRTLYLQACSPCHGPKGKGDGPAAVALQPRPHDLSRPVMWTQSDGALFWKISTGKSPMPTFSQAFKNEQIWTLVNFIRTLSPRQVATRK